MIPRRIYVNLVAFLGLFVALCTWAASQLISVDALEQPYEVTAYFDEAPGLRANVEVTYLGVRVGQIRSVSLVDGAAEVTLAMRRGTELPLGVSAAVRRKSAAGEPYVALEAPDDWSPGDGYLPDDGTYVIEVADTATALSYGELFSAVDSLLSAVNPDDLGTVLGELSTALAGRGDELRTIFARGADLTTTLAARSGELDRLATELTALTSTIADKSATIADSTDDLALLVDALSDSTADVDALLDRAPRLGAQVNDLLAATASDIRCGFEHTAGVASVVARPASMSQIVRLLFAAKTAGQVIPKGTIQGPDGPYLAGTFGFAPGSLASDYAEFIALPEPPPLEACPDGQIDIGNAPGDSSMPGGPGGAPLADIGDEAAAPETDPSEAPASTEADVDDDDFSFLALLVALAALLAAAAAAASRPWRRWAITREAAGAAEADAPIDLEGPSDDGA